MPRLSERLYTSMPFIFQHVLLENPRTPYSELGRRTGCSRHTAKRHLHSFYQENVLFPPQWRLLISNQICEYIYLLKVDDPESFIPLLKKQKMIFYYCLLAGPFNLIVYSYAPVDLSHIEGFEQTIISGIRSRFCAPRVLQRNYETAFKRISQRCELKIEPSMIDMELKNTAWTEELWSLYNDLKYNVGRDFTFLVKKYGFKTTTFYERIKQISLFTDLFVPLYPLGENNYLLFYLLIKTKYQKVIVDSFGELPVFSVHTRIKDSLLSYIPVPRGMEEEHFSNILLLWKQKGIIDSYQYSIPLWSWHIDSGMLFPPPPVPASLYNG